MSGEPSGLPPRWRTGVVHHTGAYALIRGRWRPTRTVPKAPETRTVKVYADDPDGGVVEEPVQDIEQLVRVRPFCVYRDLPFELSRVLDASDRLVWHDVPWGAESYRVQLLLDFSHPQWRRAAGWDGFEADRAMGFVVGRVPLTDIRDYSEEITAVALNAGQSVP